MITQHKAQRHGHPRAGARLSAFLVTACLLSTLFTRSAAGQEAAASASAGLYVRTDSDKTDVITPRLRVTAPLGSETTVDVVYSVDVWSSASIDIRTSASQNVQDINSSKSDASLIDVSKRTKPVTERRDQIDLGLAHVMDTLSLNGSYRYSSEPDYKSHGGSLGFSLDMAQRASTLELSVGGSLDVVGRADDPLFEEGVRNLNVRTAFTQVLTQDLLVQLIYELGNNHGYLASPYRYVAPGSWDGRCKNFPQAPDYAVYQCIPEHVPSDRLRHAIAATGRQALGSMFSLGASYRFYIDSWSVLSHTAQADLAFIPLEHTFFSLGYRFYTQTSADFYRSSYPRNPDFATIGFQDGPNSTLRNAFAGEYYTVDKELSALDSHRVSLDIEQHFDLSAGGQIKALASLAPTFYTFHNFKPFAGIGITAFEATVALVFEP